MQALIWTRPRPVAPCVQSMSAGSGAASPRLCSITYSCSRQDTGATGKERGQGRLFREGGGGSGSALGRPLSPEFEHPLSNTRNPVSSATDPLPRILSSTFFFLQAGHGLPPEAWRAHSGSPSFSQRLALGNALNVGSEASPLHASHLQVLKACASVTEVEAAFQKERERYPKTTPPSLGAVGARRPTRAIRRALGARGGGAGDAPNRAWGRRMMAWLRRPQSHFWIRNANFAYSGSARPGEANASRWALPPLAHVYSLGLKHSV